jgi:hypothetical protein
MFCLQGSTRPGCRGGPDLDLKKVIFSSNDGCCNINKLFYVRVLPVSGIVSAKAGLISARQS